MLRNYAIWSSIILEQKYILEILSKEFVNIFWDVGHFVVC